MMLIMFLSFGAQTKMYGVNSQVSHLQPRFHSDSAVLEQRMWIQESQQTCWPSHTTVVHNILNGIMRNIMEL